jgi:hypothetical protein
LKMVVVCWRENCGMHMGNAPYMGKRLLGSDIT